MTAPLLRDPVADFVNRHAEKRVIEDFREGRRASGKRCLIVRARRDVGLTFFLRHIEQTVEAPWFAVYADCRSSDPEVIFRTFFDKLEERKFARWRALNVFRELGEATIRLLAPIFLPAGPAALVGPFAGAVLPKVATTAYSSTPSERFAKLVTSGRWKSPVLFLVDNAQEIKPQSLNILTTAFSPRYDHVRFVLSFVSGEADSDVLSGFADRIDAVLGAETIEFQPPGDNLVTEIAAAFGRPLTSEQRSELLRVSRGSVTRLIRALSGANVAEAALTTIEQEVLRYLLVAEQPLRHDDVQMLVLRSARLVAAASAVTKSIEALAKKGFVVSRSHWLGAEIEILPGASRRAREIVGDVFDVVAAEELYRYFSDIGEMRSPRHSESAYGALLYKLAKQVDPVSVPNRAFDLVRISLAQGDLQAAEHYISQAVGTAAPRSIADIYTTLAFQISIQEYDLALSTLDRFGDGYWKSVRTLRVIHAIALNRVRAHGASNAEIDALLAEPTTTNEEFALLTSYKVAGLLHEGSLDEARWTFETSRPRIAAAQNRGYALRNCAAVYFWGPRRDHGRAGAILSEAIDVFESQRDAFGLSTARNNMGALMGSSASWREGAARALPIFREAFDALAVFGTQHLEEAGANVGIALVLTGDADAAAKHLRKTSAIASFDFPRVIMESALAFADAMLGDAHGARERMSQLTARVRESPLPEAVYRANVNAAAIEIVTGGGALQWHVDAARRAGFWAGTASLDRVLAAHREGTITDATLPQFLSYDYFQYWSQNPLSIVAPPILPEKTVGEDVAH